MMIGSVTTALPASYPSPGDTPRAGARVDQEAFARGSERVGIDRSAATTRPGEAQASPPGVMGAPKDKDETARVMGARDPRDASAKGGEKDEASSGSAAEPENERGLTEDEQKAVRALEARDREVRAHEAAHMRAGGDLVRGGASFSYQRGPDGRQYAIGGEVSIDTSSGSTPAETIARAERIRAAALAPAEPSAQDMQVAAEATRMAAEARAAQASAGQAKPDANPYQPRVQAERGAIIDQYA